MGRVGRFAASAVLGASRTAGSVLSQTASLAAYAFFCKSTL